MFNAQKEEEGTQWSKHRRGQVGGSQMPKKKSSSKQSVVASPHARTQREGGYENGSGPPEGPF